MNVDVIPRVMIVYYLVKVFFSHVPPEPPCARREVPRRSGLSVRPRGARASAPERRAAAVRAGDRWLRGAWHYHCRRKMRAKTLHRIFKSLIHEIHVLWSSESYIPYVTPHPNRKINPMVPPLYSSPHSHIFSWHFSLDHFTVP